MDAQQLIRYMDTNGVPYTITGTRLRVMDLTLLPGRMRESFDERGFYVSEKQEAAAAAVAKAQVAQAEADEQAKDARATGEEAALEAAKAQTAALREILPMGETEREMTTVGLLNPTGDTNVPAHLESHEPKPPQAPAADLDDEGTKKQAANPKHLRGPLPEGFPGKAAFEAAGYNTYAKVRAVRKAGTKVDGVGDATNAAVDEIFSGEEEL